MTLVSLSQHRLNFPRASTPIWIQLAFALHREKLQQEHSFQSIFFLFYPHLLISPSHNVIVLPLPRTLSCRDAFCCPALKRLIVAFWVISWWQVCEQSQTWGMLLKFWITWVIQRSMIGDVLSQLRLSKWRFSLQLHVWVLSQDDEAAPFYLWRLWICFCLKTL